MHVEIYDKKKKLKEKLVIEQKLIFNIYFLRAAAEFEYSFSNVFVGWEKRVRVKILPNNNI